MRSLRLCLTGAALAAAATAACSSDTAILVRVTRASSAPATIARLQVAIGVESATAVVAPEGDSPAGQTVPTYVDDVPATERIDTSKIDLATAPYEVLLRPSATLPMTDGLALAAVGWDGDGQTANPIAVGTIDHAVHFQAGDELVYEITLAPVAEVAPDEARGQCGTLDATGAKVYGCKRGCFGFTGTAGPIWIGAHDDIDCDGDPHGTDCDDYDWQVNHQHAEVCANNKDDDCNGKVDDVVDKDGDGFTTCTGDCAEGNPNVYPGSPGPELCDGYDEACDGVLYPATSMCFGTDTSTGGCKVGTRTCDDASPPGGFSACMLGNVPAPDSLCSAFGSCANAPDPIACVVQGLTNVTRMACQAQLDRTGSPPPLCPVPPSSYEAPVPAIAGTTNCTGIDWFVAGGAMHGAWTVGLVDPLATGGTPDTMVTGACNVDLVVTAVGGNTGATAPPPPTTFFVFARMGTTITLVVVDLSGVINGDCPDGPAMQCHLGA